MATVREMGKRWHPKLPRYSITRIVDRMHVATPDAEVTAEIENRIASHGAFPPDLVPQALAYALAVHARNRSLYARVQRGR
jgi:hypothetical protein